MTAQTSFHDDLIHLVNQSGKLRMLSHRAVMMMLLAQSDIENAEKHQKKLEKAIQLFFEFSQPLIDPRSVEGDMRDCALFLAKNTVFDVEDINAAKYFLSQSRDLQQDVVKYGKIETLKLSTFADFVSETLLDRLNNMLQAIENQIAKITQNEQTEAEHKTEIISHSIDELEKSTRMVFMISLNASIEASRLASEGEGFKQIVREIRDLSDKMGQSAAKLKSQLITKSD